MNSTVTFTETAETITLGNDWLALGFSKESGALVSLVDRQSGYQFLRDAEAPRRLYRLALRRPADGSLRWIEGDESASISWAVESNEGGAALVLCSSPEPAVRVTVRVRLDAGAALSAWRMEVACPEEASAYQLVCPVLSGLVRVGESVPGEAILFPRQGEAYLFRDPYPARDGQPLRSGAGPEAPDVGIGEMHGVYPGNIALQMVAYYNDRAGLYVAAHDAGQHPKSFDLAPLPGSTAPALSVCHFLGEPARVSPPWPPNPGGNPVGSNCVPPRIGGPGGRDPIPYDTVVGVFHGDWCDAADLYKAWATRQAWCAKKLWERDIPAWMHAGFGVWQMSNYHIPQLDLNHSLLQIADEVGGLSRGMGVPLLSLVFNWEGGGGWTGPAGFFPPREGEETFGRAMRRLREAGCLGFVYMTGGCWYLKLPYDPPFDSWSAFEAEGRPHAVMAADGTVPVGRWYAGWESTRLCPVPAYTRELTAGVFLRCLEMGATVVQIDNFPCGGPEACHDPAHGHPPGYGPWWAEAWAGILAEVRRRARERDPECAMSTEGVSEGFLPFLDLFDQRAPNMEYFGHYAPGMPMGGETVPLFTYVYGQYIGAYTAAMPECNRPEVLYWTRCLGKALAEGVVPTAGRYFPEPRESNPVTLGFYKKVVRAAAQECWPYLMFGEMLRPPALDVPSITCEYYKFVLDDKRHYVDPAQRHEVRDKAVQTAAWRARDGSIGTVFANAGLEPVAFELEVSGHGADAPAFDVERITDGVHEPWLRGVSLPRRERVEMAPLSVTLVVVRPAGG